MIDIVSSCSRTSPPNGRVEFFFGELDIFITEQHWGIEFLVLRSIRMNTQTLSSRRSLLSVCKPIGIARYPMGVNKKTVRRPDGVRDGELITVEHDQEMVRNLFRQLILYISSGYYGMEQSTRRKLDITPIIFAATLSH